MKILAISFISICIVSAIIPACKNKSAGDAQQLAENIQSTVKEHTPGAVAASGTGYYMKAKIDGKQWAAAYMLPDESASSSYKTIHGETGNTYINFMLWRNGISNGKSEPIDDEHAANLSVEDVPGFWSGKTGEVKITTLDDKWVEGTFHFDATSQGNPGRTIHVTEGSFRVPAQNIR
jgi:hypothetical protein